MMFLFSGHASCRAKELSMDQRATSESSMTKQLQCHLCETALEILNYNDQVTVTIGDAHNNAHNDDGKTQR